MVQRESLPKGFKLIGKVKIHAEVPSEFDPTEDEYHESIQEKRR
jgi:hypothetical protein